MTFSDVDSNAVLKLKFKTMPVRTINKNVVGEPYFFYDIECQLNNNGEYKEFKIIDEKDVLRRYRPYPIF